ncbi:MAG TPA: serine/threonine-protein kinase [Gemmatimonadales bacterium]|nr:serine/threonine-protein kinase [Gemmatimonadales bacterium]
MPEPLTPDLLRRLRGLFDDAVVLPPEQRTALIEQIRADQPFLARELESLLRAHDSTDEHLATLVSGDAMRKAFALDQAWRGRRVGSYEVGERIGIGGMGDVYHAVRADSEFSKQVAIKFLRRSAESDLAVRRFRYERQILANLNHRNVAALLDGGVTEDGQPYFVMELVEGKPITAWCDECRLDVAGRLALFRQVCTAVQHAHRNLVIHRDLKPGNILVTEDGTVKLLDFGIAKLLREEEGSDQLPATQGGGRVFTPEYAAPEQVRGLPAGTGVDVYALGVVLFELITGTRPFDLSGKLIAEIEEIVVRRPPPRPSSLITATRSEALGSRSLSRTTATVRGDVDAIILMALRKEPDRRYGSADELSRDISLHLAGMPVNARPEGLGYRIGKLIRRRKVEVLGGSVAVASLLGGIIATSLYARSAAQERDRVVEVTSFLSSMLSAVDPSQLGREVTMREVLDSAAVRANTLTGKPKLEHEIRSVIGNTYMALGNYDLAIAEFRSGLAAARRDGPSGTRAVAQALAQLATAYENASEWGVADSIFREAQAIMTRIGYRDLGEERDWIEHRGRLLSRLGNYREAAPLQRRALELHQAVEPENDSALAYYYHNYAQVIGELGDQPAADSLFRAALEIESRSLGIDHPLHVATLSAHSVVLERLGDLDGSERELLAVLDARRRLLGEEHPDYAWTMFNYADHLERRGRHAEAAEWARKVLALRGRSLDDSHIGISTAMQVLGRALAGLDSMAEAETLLRESLELRRTHYPGHWAVASSESVLGDHLARRGRFAEAEPLLLTSERQLVEARGPQAGPVQDARQRLVHLYTAWGKPDEAARWQARLDSEAP